MRLFRALRKKSPLMIRTAIVSLIVLATVITLSQSVLAKTTYLIFDGGKLKFHTTYETNPMDILDEAGVSLDQMDNVVVTPGNGVNEITVQRGQRLTIDLFGEPLQTVAYDETVGDLLNRLNLNTDGKGLVSVPLDTKATEGMTIQIYSLSGDQATYTVEVPFETVYQKTDYLDAGVEVILTQGVNGVKTCVDHLTFVNGVETGRVLFSEEVTVAPVTQIVAVGTGSNKRKPGNPIIGDGVIITSEGKVLKFDSVGIFEATAYMTMPPYTYDTTATGTKVHKGSVAVDPTVIPYGTKMFIVSCDGKFIYGEGTAEDCGPAIKNDRVDLFYFTFDECAQFGRRDCYVYFLTE